MKELFKSTAANTILGYIDLKFQKAVEIEIENTDVEGLNKGLLDNIILYVESNIDHYNKIASSLLIRLYNSRLIDPSKKLHDSVEFSFAGIAIDNNSPSFNKFQMYYEFESFELIHNLEEYYGKKTLNFSGGFPYVYLSGCEWIY